METLEKDLDVRDKWLGIKRLKSTYRPMPYDRNDETGKHVRKKERAVFAARYLKIKQWGKTRQIIREPGNQGREREETAEEEMDRKTREGTIFNIIKENDVKYNLGDIQMEEIRDVIKNSREEKHQDQTKFQWKSLRK